MLLPPRRAAHARSVLLFLLFLTAATPKPSKSRLPVRWVSQNAACMPLPSPHAKVQSAAARRATHTGSNQSARSQRASLIPRSRRVRLPPPRTVFYACRRGFYAAPAEGLLPRAPPPRARRAREQCRAHMLFAVAAAGSRLLTRFRVPDMLIGTSKRTPEACLSNIDAAQRAMFSVAAAVVDAHLCFQHVLEVPRMKKEEHHRHQQVKLSCAAGYARLKAAAVGSAALSA